MLKGSTDGPAIGLGRFSGQRGVVVAAVFLTSLLASAPVIAKDTFDYVDGVYKCGCSLEEGDGKTCSCHGQSVNAIGKGKTDAYEARCTGTYQKEVAGYQTGATQILNFKEASGDKDKSKITCATNQMAGGKQGMSMECTNWSTKQKKVNLVIVCVK
ncbi:MAG: hypothetical protein GC201_08875 [Alphaproteobacteria bacterium]|nr:hypothetical protein [Alphaproteobacteria bacterium]